MTILRWLIAALVAALVAWRENDHEELWPH